jgi:hypothetical protein
MSEVEMGQSYFICEGLHPIPLVVQYDDKQIMIKLLTFTFFHQISSSYLH